MKTAIVIGVKGMLGYAVSTYFSQKGYAVKGLSRNEFDAAKDSMETLEKFIANSDVVINCAGVIKPRMTDTPIEDVVRVNSIFPRNLAKLCKRLQIPCFHVTTDCVYSGKRGMYTESDYFDADDMYGMTKNAGEQSECMVIRTSIIGEEHGQQRSLLEWARGSKGKEVSGFTNHRWNGVTTVYLAELIETILNKNLYQTGVIHLYSPNIVTKYELLQIFDEVYNLSLLIKPAEAKIVCDRSLSSDYALSKQIAVKTIKQQVAEMKAFFERSSSNAKAL
jgi:dTDP-4-dehydrorhamnose reductase